MTLNLAKAALGVMSILASAALASAQDFPARPVRVVVPFPAGGATDVLGRLIAQRLGESFGQQFIVDNRAGASGAIGTEAVAKAPPDGYTLLFASASTQAIHPAVSKVPFDPVRDFTPIAFVAAAPLALVTHPSLPAKSVAELIALAKAKPGQLNMASFGSGTVSHLAGELFKSMTGIDMTHVPYKGGAPAMSDLIAGQVQLSFDTFSNTQGPTKAGRIRLLAVTGSQRVGAVPDTPTVAEAGVPGFEASSWFGLLGPANTPTAIVARIADRTAAILAIPAVREQLAAQGNEPQSGRPDELSQALKRDYAKWGKLVRDANLKIE